MKNRKLPVFFLAALIAMTTVAPSEVYELIPGVLNDFKAIGRDITYAMILCMFCMAAWNIARTGKGAKPGIVAASYGAMYLFIAAKFSLSDFSDQVMPYVFASLVYVTVFGLYLRKRSVNLDASMVVTAIGLANILLLALNTPSTQWEEALSPTGRLVGFAFNSNILAYALTLTSVCLFALVRHIRRWFVRLVVLLALLSLNYYLVVQTLSRGAFVLLCLSAALNLYLLAGRYAKVFLLALPFLAAGAYFYFESSAVIDLMFNDRFDTREFVIQRQMRDFSSHPIFGAPFLDSRIVYGENLILGAGAMLGVFGVACVALICLPRFWTYLRLGWSRNTHKGDRLDFRLAACFIGMTMISGALESLLLGVIGPAIICFLLLDAAAAHAQPLPIRRSTYPTLTAHP